MAATIRPIPVHSMCVPNFFERIIDKKVQGVALSFFEQFIHFTSYYLFYSYHTLFTQKMSRVSLFGDGMVRLVNCTNRVVAVARHRYVKDKDQSLLIDVIYLNGRRVLFDPFGSIKMFSKVAQVERVTVQDIRSNFVGIIETDVANRKEVVWEVNLNHIHSVDNEFNHQRQPSEEVYLAVKKS